ncbi:MAG: aminodeoxychorismate synthase component I, partial [Pyrinomonadaceae bacterium]
LSTQHSVLTSRYLEFSDSTELLQALLALDPTLQVHILDSCRTLPNAESDREEARYLIAGFEPVEVVNQNHYNRDLLSLLDARLVELNLAGIKNHSTTGFGGACIATFSYELVHQIEHLRTEKFALEEPIASLAFFDTMIVHDYFDARTKIISTGGEKRLRHVQKILEDSRTRSERQTSKSGFVKGVAVEASSNFTRQQYLNTIEKIRGHIYAGDIYQANLTQRLTCPLHEPLTPEQVFLNLRRDHPASFAAFIRRDSDVVISASPERFISVCLENNTRMAEMWPIKGTRPRGRTPAEDAELRTALLTSQKDRSENIMIVDLVRNDLGRISEYGSVEVKSLCEIQEHPTLWHLISKVRSRLRADVTPGELIRAIFPCGSVTGAPKIRAMEIISEMEHCPRGISMGAIGYFGFDGHIDLSVAIRTMTIREGKASFNVGGGIVAESRAEDEYEESLLKARALLAALHARF